MKNEDKRKSKQNKDLPDPGGKAKEGLKKINKERGGLEKYEKWRQT